MSIIGLLIKLVSLYPTVAELGTDLPSLLSHISVASISCVDDVTNEFAKLENEVAKDSDLPDKAIPVTMNPHTSTKTKFDSEFFFVPPLANDKAVPTTKNINDTRANIKNIDGLPSLYKKTVLKTFTTLFNCNASSIDFISIFLAITKSCIPFPANFAVPFVKEYAPCFIDFFKLNDACEFSKAYILNDFGVCPCPSFSISSSLASSGISTPK